MTEVKILIQGWTNADSVEKGEEENDACTTSLVLAGEYRILVDPGVLNDQQILVDSLAKEGLAIKDITHIFITHSHIDHYRNVGMFPATTPVVEYWGEWIGGKPKERPKNIGPDIEIIKTPGHSYDGLSMLVKTDKGTVAIVGDVFWKENYPDKDPYALDNEKLSESRKKVLTLSDYIIPGHGGVYKAKG